MNSFRSILPAVLLLSCTSSRQPADAAATDTEMAAPELSLQADAAGTFCGSDTDSFPCDVMTEVCFGFPASSSRASEGECQTVPPECGGVAACECLMLSFAQLCDTHPGGGVVATFVGP
ncbi:MAG: hypothetical protein AAF411_18615 [Myxococcota bacterium]